MAEKQQMITMERSILTGYKGKIKGSTHSVAVEVCTVLTTKIAEYLDARWVLFDKDSMPKQFHKVELDNEFRGVRVRFAVKGLEAHELAFDPDMITKFVVQRKGDGKKKAKILALKFNCQYRGNIHDLIDTFERLGSGEGTLTIEHLQATLQFVDLPPQPAKKTKRKDNPLLQ